jgi:hypothetical protein
MLEQGLTRAVLMAHGYICRYCGGVADSADHIVPRVLGGSDEPRNLTATCRACNGRKGGERLIGAIETELLTEAHVLAPFVADAVRHYKAARAIALRRNSLRAP